MTVPCEISNNEHYIPVEKSYSPVEKSYSPVEFHLMLLKKEKEFKSVIKKSNKRGSLFREVG